ncbi:MAG TPA: glycosyltransferase [Burkholderiales bacterium]
MKRTVVLVAGEVDLALAARLAGRFELVELRGGPLALAAAVLRTGAAIVHLDAAAGCLARSAAAKLGGAAVLWQIDEGPPPAGRALCAALADALVAPSAAQAQSCRERLPRQLVVHIAPGIDCAPFQRLNRAPVTADAPLRLAYLGPLESGQGLAEMIEGLRLARESGVRARLVIAGSGGEEPRLRHQAADAGLGRDVVFAGETAAAGRARLYLQCDALLLPAYSAGVPRVLLEAMAAGVVPVASAVGGIPEVVGDAETGLLIEPGDALAIAGAIARLARERSHLARMSAACRRRIATRFSVERAAAELSALYFMLAAAPRARAAL